MERLSVAGARALTRPGLYRADPTLYLHVSKGGAKSWIQRIAVNGRRRDIGLGPFALVTLAEARDKAYQNRRLVQTGGNPLAEKRKAKAPTFREAAERTYEANKARWRNAKTGAIWRQQLELHAFKRLGEMRVDQIGREDVLAVLTPVWSGKPETGRRLRRAIKTTLAWALAHGFVDRNVATEVDGALPTLPSVKEHYRALPYRELPGALRTVEGSAASLPARLAFRWLALTACRSLEAREAKWAEVEEESRLWVLPGNRTKTGAEFRQPLSAAALDVLDQARALRDESDYLFPSPARRGRPLSSMALIKLTRDVGLAERMTPHSVRASFRTWASERTSADFAAMEMSLGHHVGSAVERSYARSDLLEKRRRLMQQWGQFLTGESAGNVVPLHG